MEKTSHSTGDFSLPVVVPRSSHEAGIKGWMPVGAFFAGLVIFGLVLLAASGVGVHSQQEAQSNAPAQAQSTQPQQQPATTGSGTAR
jgi:hypothetical protein